MTEATTYLENVEKNKNGFLLIQIFNGEAERIQRVQQALVDAKKCYEHLTIRPLAVMVSEYGAISSKEMAKAFSLSDEGWNSKFEEWLNVKGRSSSDQIKIIEKFISMINARAETVEDRLRVDLNYNDGPDDNDPWYMPFILTENGGFFTSGFDGDPTHNTFNKVADNQYEIVRGVHSIQLHFEGEILRYKDCINGKENEYRFQKMGNPFIK